MTYRYTAKSGGIDARIAPNMTRRAELPRRSFQARNQKNAATNALKARSTSGLNRASMSYRIAKETSRIASPSPSRPYATVSTRAGGHAPERHRNTINTTSAAPTPKVHTIAKSHERHPGLTFGWDRAERAATLCTR